MPCLRIFPCCCCWNLLAACVPDSLGSALLVVPFGLLYAIGFLIGTVFWIPAITYAVINRPFKYEYGGENLNFYYHFINQVTWNVIHILLGASICALLLPFIVAWFPIGLFIIMGACLIKCVRSRDGCLSDENVWPLLFLPVYVFLWVIFNDDS